MSGKEDGGLRALFISVPFLFLVLVWVSFLSRPVLEFGPVRQIPNGVPGQTAILNVRVSLERPECRVASGTTWVTFRDSSASDYAVNQHSGFIPEEDLTNPDRQITREMSVRFEVPLYATQGPAEVTLLSSWECPMSFGLIHSISPAYPFEVTDD